MSDHGLGRLYIPDSRDRRFLMAEAPLPEPTRKYRYWSPGPIMDQGPLPHCVGFAWSQWLQCNPIRTLDGPAPDNIYTEAQKVDEWPGEDYDGTSVRGGAKVLQALGHVEEYRWCYDVETLKHWLLVMGPVVLGTTWTNDMFYPDTRTFISPTGSPAGGHAYLCYGYSYSYNAFRCINSWGSGWGSHRGRFYIGWDDMQLLLDDFGEACAAVERKL